MQLECQDINSAWGTRVDISVKWEILLFNNRNPKCVKKKKKLIHQPVVAEPTSGGSSRKRSCTNEGRRFNIKEFGLFKHSWDVLWWTEPHHSSRETVYGMATLAPNERDPRVPRWIWYMHVSSGDFSKTDASWTLGMGNVSPHLTRLGSRAVDSGSS